MQERPTLNEKVNLALAAGGLHYTPGSLKIRHLLDVLIHDIGADAIRRNVVRPLTGLRVAPYLGCMVPRPDYDHRWSNHEYPTELDQVLKALGAEVIDFPLKTHCCGGHMTQISPPVAYELIRRLLHGASEYRADMMVTLCPMCQLNLDAYQGETNQYFHTNYRMPVLFFTQLIALAFGKDPQTLGIGRELVDARPALSRIGVEVPLTAEGQMPAPPKPRRVKKQGLPMPRMPGDEEVTP
jgi:heterodisulfide reductase subunit B